MNKNLRVLLAACLLCGVLKAQYEPATNPLNTTKNNDNGEIKAGTSIVNVYYGPQLVKGLLNAVWPDDVINLKFTSVGPIGGVYEYIIQKRVGIGAELGYSELRVSYNRTVTTLSGETVEHTDKLRFTHARAMLRTAYHYYKPKLDMYFFVSAGYKRRTIIYSTSEPLPSIEIPTPFYLYFGVKPGFGFRYFFAKHIGLNAEFALGTPIICGGLSFKI